MADNSAGLPLRLRARFAFGLYLTLLIVSIYAALRCLFFALRGKWEAPCPECGHHTLRELFDGVVYVNVCMYLSAFERGAIAYETATLRELQQLMEPVRMQLKKPHRVNTKKEK